MTQYTHLICYSHFLTIFIENNCSTDKIRHKLCIRIILRHRDHVAPWPTSQAIMRGLFATIPDNRTNKKLKRLVQKAETYTNKNYKETCCLHGLLLMMYITTTSKTNNTTNTNLYNFFFYKFWQIQICICTTLSISCQGALQLCTKRPRRQKQWAHFSFSMIIHFIFVVYLEIF